MKNKIPYLTAVALAATILVGCQRQPESNPPPAENTPSAPANTNSAATTNQSQANVPAVPGSSGAILPASTNR